MRLENPGDDDLAAFRQAWLRHVAIQEQVAGATAEAGRALAQFKMAANSRAVRGEVLAGLLDKGGGRERIKEAAETLLETAEVAPDKFNVLAGKLTKPRWIDKAVQLRYFFMLSGPRTHAANVISNTLTALGQFPEHAAASVIGLGRRAVVGQEAASDRVYGTELGARAFGLLQGVKEGLGQFARTVRTGQTSDHFGKVEMVGENEPIKGKLGVVVGMPTRLLAAEDELFKSFIFKVVSGAVRT